MASPYRQLCRHFNTWTFRYNFSTSNAGGAAEHVNSLLGKHKVVLFSKT